MRDRVDYEWESLDEESDWYEVDHDKSLERLLARAAGSVSLVRRTGNDCEGVTDLQRAFPNADGSLPSEFDGGARVPVKFLREWTRADRGKRD